MITYQALEVFLRPVGAQAREIAARLTEIRAGVVAMEQTLRDETSPAILPYSVRNPLELTA